MYTNIFANFLYIVLNFVYIYKIDYSSLLHDPFTLDWIETSITKIISEHTKSVHGFAFTCQLLALLSENEEVFRKINDRNIYDK